MYMIPFKSLKKKKDNTERSLRDLLKTKVEKQKSRRKKKNRKEGLHAWYNRRRGFVFVYTCTCLCVCVCIYPKSVAVSTACVLLYLLRKQTLSVPNKRQREAQELCFFFSLLLIFTAQPPRPSSLARTPHAGQPRSDPPQRSVSPHHWPSLPARYAPPPPSPAPPPPPRCVRPR